jgi:hypothetical protein
MRSTPAGLNKSYITFFSFSSFCFSGGTQNPDCSHIGDLQEIIEAVQHEQEGNDRFFITFLQFDLQLFCFAKIWKLAKNIYHSHTMF